MDVLVISDAYPFPLQNGHALRIYHYVRLLRDRHNFDLLCFAEKQPPADIVSLFRRITWIPRPNTNSPDNSNLRRFKEAFSVNDMLATSPEMKSCLASTLEDRRYDMIWGAGDSMIAHLPAVRMQPLLGDLVDDGVLANLREAQRANSIKTALRKLKWAYLNALFERRYYGKCEHCLVVSDVDAKWFHRICPNTPISVIHNGVDEEYFKPMGGQKDAMNIVFEGNLAFGPNNDGIIYFCKAIFPLIRTYLPDITLTIVGKDPPQEVLSLASDSIEVTGYVDDIRPYLVRASVFVCPLRKGAGIKNKILQAWSMGIPVVATSHSVGGLQAHNGENIIVSDVPGEFSAAVVELINNPDKCLSMGQKARETILNHYTWSQKAQEMESLMMTMIEKFKPPHEHG